MRRKIRRSVDIILTAVGIAIIFCTVLFSASLTLQVQILAALMGVLLMEVGVWGLSSRIYSSERKYTGLREEGDNILNLVRELHAAAVAKDRGDEDARRFQATLQEMHTSVERMASLAGSEDNPPG